MWTCACQRGQTSMKRARARVNAYLGPRVRLDWVLEHNRLGVARVCSKDKIASHKDHCGTRARRVPLLFGPRTELGLAARETLPQCLWQHVDVVPPPHELGKMCVKVFVGPLRGKVASVAVEHGYDRQFFVAGSHVRPGPRVGAEQVLRCGEPAPRPNPQSARQHDTQHGHRWAPLNCPAPKLTPAHISREDSLRAGPALLRVGQRVVW